MTAFLWLVWYDSHVTVVPRHWALAVTYEAHDRAYATFYEVTGEESAGCYSPRVSRRKLLMSNHGTHAYGGKLLMGEIIDSVVSTLELYGETAADLVNSYNQKRGVRESNCQDWAIIIVRSLEDAQLLPHGVLAKVEKCPRLG